jgi:predicted nucleotidyltransferase
MTLEQVREYRNEILHLADRYGAENVRVFGSTVRGEATQNSDVDFLVDMRPGTGIAIGGLLEDLKDLLQTKVDLQTEAMLSPYIIADVLREARPL